MRAGAAELPHVLEAQTRVAGSVALVRLRYPPLERLAATISMR